MDSGVVNSPHVHDQQVEQSEDEHNNGKKSVLTKVKAKAIKLKDKIREHRHGPNHDQNIPDKEDDQDEVEGIVQDPQLPGAPIYESAAVMSAIAGQEPDQEAENEVVSSCADQTDEVKTFCGEEKIGERKVRMEKDPNHDAPPESGAEAYTHPNYQSKVTDATGAGTEEVDVPSIQNSFTRMNIEDESSRNTEPEVSPTADGNGNRSSIAEGHQEGLPTADENWCHTAGSHDQFSPQQSATTETQYPCAGSHVKSYPHPTVHENSAENMETSDATNTMPEEQPNYKPMKDPSDQGSHTEKISSTKSAIDEKQLRLEEDKSENTANTSVLSGNTTSMIGSAAEYGKQIASSVTEKLAPEVISNSPGSEIPKQEKGVSMKDYLAEKLRPGDEDKALSEVISEAFLNKKEKPTKASGDEMGADAIHELKKTENGIEESKMKSPGKGGVVGKLKGMVGSWLGKAAENQTSRGGESLSDNFATEVGGSQSGEAAGGRRLPDLSN